MTKLHTFLKEKTRAKNWTLSGVDEPGEGEHKLFSRLPESLNTNTTIYIYGLDADLIMLSLLSQRPNIFLMREMNGPEPIYQFLDIDELRIGIQTEYPTVDIETYIVLCFLLGNDFIPSLSSLQMRQGGIELLISALRTINQPLVQDGKIIIETLNSLLQEIARGEDDRMWRLNEEYLKRRAPEATLHYYPLLPNKKHPLAQEIYAAGPKAAWRRLYYRALFPGETDTKIIHTACDLYIQGILWTWNYYLRRSYDSDWLYPFGYAPTAQDLFNYTSTATISGQGQDQSQSQSQSQSQKFVSEKIQLMAILPIASQAILPTQLRKYQTDPKYGIAHLYPSTFEIQTYLKYALHECPPLLPYLDFPLLERIVGK